MELAASIILSLVALFFLFQALDRLGLPSQTASASVIGREYRSAEQGYRTDIIGGQPRTVPHVTGERYVLKLDINGQQAEAAVAHSFYDEVQAGQHVQVTFQKRRITGTLIVVQVSR